MHRSKFISTLSAILAAVGLLAGSALAAADGAGLLGRQHVTASFGYVDLDGSAQSLRSYRALINQPVADGVDVFAEFDYLRSQGLGGVSLAGRHYSFKTASVGARGFLASGAVRPFVEALAGWTWFSSPFWDENSFQWSAGAGVEFSFAQRWSVAPQVRYVDPVDLFTGERWQYGLRADVVLTPKLSLTAAIERNDDRDTEYRLGATWRL